MQKKLHIKKGDQVIVNTGEYKGQKGRVLNVDRDKNRAIVEGVFGSPSLRVSCLPTVYSNKLLVNALK